MKKTYNIEIDCPNCANLCEAESEKINGVSSATVNYMTQKMIIEFNEGVDEKRAMKDVIKACKRIEPDFSIVL